ncbi:AsmA family protein [Hymenobacter persicinus]|uniref:DUF748 domain-containing protein n=1 Tax=Hymenobacter persicinus TaxID=2025506 RepID=A0A4Q5L853_9BACT|nr:hypothetical protein [Hymenobacter persicinus]RYU77785.1 hypothetical protein EWM57_16790 [Hymenobacter persicinus]
MLEEPPRVQRPPKWLRWVGGILVGLAVLVVAALLLLDPWLCRTLEKQVATQTQGRYRLQIGELRTSLWHRSVRLRNLRLRPVKDERRWSDTTALPRLLANVSQLRVSGVGLWAALRGQVVPVDTVLLTGVQLRVLHLPPSSATARPLHQRLPGRLAGLALGYVGVQKLQAAYGPARRPQASLRRADFALQDVLLTAAGAADTQRVGYAKAGQLQVAGVAGRAAQHAVALGRGQFSTTTGRLTLDSVRIRPLRPQGLREKLPKVDLRLPQLLLTGLRANELARRQLRLDSVLVEAPQLTFTPPQQPPPALYKLVAPYLRRLTLAHVRLTRGNVRVAGVNSRPTVRGISLTGTRLRIDQAAAFDPTRVFYAEAWQAHTGAVTARVSAPVYRGGYDALDLDTRPGTLNVRGLLLVPTMSATGVNRLKGHQAPNLTLRLPQLRVVGLDFAALDLHGSLLAQQVTLSRPMVLIDGDGNFPLNPKPSIVTPERLGRLPLRLNVRLLTITQATVRTSYLSPASGRAGTLTFNRLNGTLRNLTNDPRLMSAAHPAVARASGYVANRWRADLQIWLPLLDPNGAHWGRATFGTGPITVLNSMTEPSRNVRFASGNVQQATIQFRADRQGITGTMRARYSDLKLTLLSKKGGADHKTIFTKIGSSLLNGLVVRDENPRRDGRDLKVGQMDSRRELRVSVFSLWRQGLVSGLLNSIGAPKKLARKISEQQ